MALYLRLNTILDKNEITRNALAREAKVRPNLIYDMYEGKTKRIDLTTLDTIIVTLKKMGVNVDVADLIEYVPDE